MEIIYTFIASFFWYLLLFSRKIDANLKLTSTDSDMWNKQVTELFDKITDINLGPEAKEQGHSPRRR